MGGLREGGIRAGGERHAAGEEEGEVDAPEAMVDGGSHFGLREVGCCWGVERDMYIPYMYLGYFLSCEYGEKRRRRRRKYGVGCERECMGLLVKG